jgi:SulP family sulfate permease
VPGSIIALVGGTLAVALFNIPVETIGSKFGGIPRIANSHMPALSWKTFSTSFNWR